jgi:3-hydroxyisobutyrate dehydrogenase
MLIGFIGTGLMGEPMAANLVRAGFDVRVWNRSRSAPARLEAAGATRGENPCDVLRRCEATIVMLSTEDVITDVLRPGSDEFRTAVAGRGLVHMGTTSADFSADLGEAVRRAGGWYAEAPVSGSRTPAEMGQLVAMAAGDDDRLDELEPVLAAMCHRVLRCGPPPAGTRMKFAVNIYLIGLVTALAEAYHFARAVHLDLPTFVEAVNSGQMACPIAAVKLDKLQRGDLSPQAAIPDVYKNSRLIGEAARRARLGTPLLDTCHELYREAVENGFADLDMVGVLRAIEMRTDWIRLR